MKIPELKKNITATPDGGLIYNFGKKRPATNFTEMLEDRVWKEILLNKWVCIRDEDNGVTSFVKHFCEGNRMLQIVYSGRKYFCDGLYRLYQVKVVPVGADGIFIDPRDFSVAYSPLTISSAKPFVDRLIEDGYLSEAEKAIFLDRKARKEFAKTLFQLKYDF